MDAWHGIVCTREEGRRSLRRRKSRHDDSLVMTSHQPSVPDFDDLDDDDDDDDGEYLHHTGNGANARATGDDEDKRAQYLIKHGVTGSHLFVYLSDGRHVWTAVHARSELAALNERFNPSVEINTQSLLSILSKNIFGGDTSTTTYRLRRHTFADAHGGRGGNNDDEDEEEDPVNESSGGDGWAFRSLTLTADTVTSARVKLHWETTLERGTLEDAYEQLTAPLMCALAVNLKYTAALEVSPYPTAGAHAELSKHAGLVDGAWVESVPFQRVFTPPCNELYKRVMQRLHPEQEPSALEPESKKSSMGAYAATTLDASADLLSPSYDSRDGGKGRASSPSLLRSSDLAPSQSPSTSADGAVPSTDFGSPIPASTASGVGGGVGVDESPLEPAFAPKRIQRRAVGKRKAEAEDKRAAPALAPAPAPQAQPAAGDDGSGEQEKKKKKKKKKRDLL
ncbi:hypothetical protein PTSG_08365 [Salpingoeca rosetta]|uniref:XLF-like N-terminal domain-containing protein n=1 Tax=Salpingoeca rosetta (strain ATCC 50818 / BSB-021) TaxID=946362 RepID=F2UJH2_SALR5|nr:uncharacterized protein PTSG_08365 [Salpingoeca rosetta]EGD77271.1 hypothetical protein PTSG_08365 [Salpingoeca rosetta]|eukprot:XP_004990615.1 hypothetical protein PTSG_08365 [Salpingoeca rosetta]